MSAARCRRLRTVAGVGSDRRGLVGRRRPCPRRRRRLLGGRLVTDGKLRELERRWKETGSVEDEARYLLERVRVAEPLASSSFWRLAEVDVASAAEYLKSRVESGDVPHDLVAVAGRFGEPTSRRALEAPPAEPEWDELVAGCQGLSRGCILEVSFALARLLLPHWLAAHPERTAPADVLLLAERLAAEGLPDLRSELLAAISTRPETLTRHGRKGEPLIFMASAASPCYLSARIALAGEGAAGRAIPRVLSHARSVIGEGSTRGAVARAVANWALFKFKA